MGAMAKRILPCCLPCRKARPGFHTAWTQTGNPNALSIRARLPRDSGFPARPELWSSDHLALPHVPDLGGGAPEPLAIDRLGIRAENRGAFQRDLAIRHP